MELIEYYSRSENMSVLWASWRRYGIKSLQDDKKVDQQVPIGSLGELELKTLGP